MGTNKWAGHYLDDGFINMSYHQISLNDDLTEMRHVPIQPFGGFHSHRGSPKKSPSLDGIFHEINHPFWDFPMAMETPSHNHGDIRLMIYFILLLMG